LLLLNKIRPISVEDTTEGDFEELLDWMVRGSRSLGVERWADVDLVPKQTPPSTPPSELGIPGEVEPILESFKDIVREGVLQQQFRLQMVEDSADEIGPAQESKSSKKRKLAPEDEIVEGGSKPNNGQEINEAVLTNYLKNLRSYDFEILLKLLIKEVVEIQKSKAQSNKFESIISMIRKAYHDLIGRNEKRKRETRRHPKTADEMNLLIGACKEDELKNNECDENVHPWKVDRNSTTPAMVLRVWDHVSQCRILNSKEGFLSGSSYEWLDTSERRKIALQNHANWRNRRSTPFISTTTDFSDAATDRIPHLL
jgi:hypothetical protein